MSLPVETIATRILHPHNCGCLLIRGGNHDSYTYRLTTQGSPSSTRAILRFVLFNTFCFTHSLSDAHNLDPRIVVRFPGRLDFLGVLFLLFERLFVPLSMPVQE